ncbi:MAG: DUF721 domain-containing protein [Bacteroidales bacterium]|nr:DUF721 domain-containing protein [Bacteroidales bacterium]
MKDYESRYRIARKEAVSMDDLVAQYIRHMKLTAGLNQQRIFAAWDELSGVSQYTLDKYCRDGVLYCRMSSSVVRSKVQRQKSVILSMMNVRLEQDPLYDNQQGFLQSIVLQ